MKIKIYFTLALIAITGINKGMDYQQKALKLAAGAAFTTSIFQCLQLSSTLIHESGHALAMKARGIDPVIFIYAPLLSREIDLGKLDY